MTSKYDTNYVESYRDKLVLTLVSLYRDNHITLTDTESNEIVSFTTNGTFQFGFALDYKWATAELTFPMRWLSREDSELGHTNSFRFSLGATKRRLWFRTFYEKNNGYYTTISETDTIYVPSSERIRSDITNTALFASLYYGFNHKKFSYMASLWQIEKQKKSAGSLIAGVTYARDDIEGGVPLPPRQLYKSYPELKSVNRLKNNYYGINLGYAGTLVLFKDFFATLTFVPGVFVRQTKVFELNKNGSDKTHRFGYSLDAKIGIGYVGKHFFTGLSVFANTLETKLRKRSQFSDEFNYARFYLGFRFKVPKRRGFLEKIGL